jgi:ABC-type transporter Mla maintaining outer membrane lipid asymmetry ATPase subunit MlaF
MEDKEASTSPSTLEPTTGLDPPLATTIGTLTASVRTRASEDRWIVTPWCDE